MPKTDSIRGFPLGPHSHGVHEGAVSSPYAKVTLIFSSLCSSPVGYCSVETSLIVHIYCLLYFPAHYHPQTNCFHRNCLLRSAARGTTQVTYELGLSLSLFLFILCTGLTSERQVVFWVSSQVFILWISKQIQMYIHFFLQCRTYNIPTILHLLFSLIVP